MEQVLVYKLTFINAHIAFSTHDFAKRRGDFYP